MDNTIIDNNKRSISGIPKTYTFQPEHIAWLEGEKVKRRKPITRILEEILEQAIDAANAKPLNSTSPTQA